MTKAEAREALKNIESASSEELEAALEQSRSDSRRNRGSGAAAGGAAGAIAGAITGKTPLQMLARGLLGAAAGGALGYGAGAMVGRNARRRMYDEIKVRRDEQVSDLLSRLDDSASYDLQRRLAGTNMGIQSNGTEYGVFAGGKGSYSKDDRIPLKKDENGRPVLSLLFAGINSSVEDGGPASAKSPLAARFYNKNRGKFSDVQANSIFDDPVVADAYVDKIVSKIMANRAKTGKYPRIRLVGYSAGGRGVVNFLRKMRERDPQFRADEVIGIDPYQFPWESVPASLRDPSNPAADKIVYSRLADNYTGSSSPGVLGRIGDTVSNTFVSLLGKKLRGIAANTVVENHLPNISHTDADTMYDSALEVLSRLNSRSRNDRKDAK